MAISQYQRKELNKLLREVMLLRDKHRCLRCGGTEKLQMSHIFPKGKYRKMAYDIDNVKTFCYSCHFHFWHKNPVEAKTWLESIIEKKRFQRLILSSQTIDKRPLDYKLIKLELEQIKKQFVY